ncbi:2-C-methyl-D-erythritol 2,4-cyclodiphosphate synthase [Treponema sp. HNW]|uniref:2-C-methyl-D-erythritol 2,4-cyclodiphosphate synthase n=1 Tax=Treponema sp. HNW TaxID=3116654 RepID=UPI003D0C53B4
MGAQKLALVLTAAGTSARFSSGRGSPAADSVKKEYEALQSPLFPEQKGGTVLSCAADAFLTALDDEPNFIFSRLIITLPPCRGHRAKALKALRASACTLRMLEKASLEPEFVEGGSDRRESVLRALEHLAGGNEPDIVLVHDAARPFVSPALVHRVLELCAEKGAAAPAVPPVDTYKEAEQTDGRIVRHLERSRLAAVQTPQGFYFKPLLDAHRRACSDSKSYTDDTEIWGAYAGDVFLCEGERSNMKITYKEDLPSSPAVSVLPAVPVYRTGLGTDTHRLVENRPLLIGGVHIPFEKGELAHSDGDVLLHAITDALLGAAALGDIGELFPPSDNRWKDADSALLLKAAWERVQKAGWLLENLDCVITIEKPKMLPWRAAVQKRIAGILGCETGRIFVKAKTAEGMGDIGEGKAVGAQCVCLLRLHAD